ncbi:MAG: glycosyltransferase family 4 protein [candidate division KSB1 bacterium]|nr:glycosyltransferase family 4 protein [candidate division KSB1 bacterium]MDZ7301499.1 glycosyltransferase family 4 protein [candidate division KSB1 bacterium]MDZ7310901.1 glycosyltransferase family 4 protein [candidate division KSB1 bacterium]
MTAEKPAEKWRERRLQSQARVAILALPKPGGIAYYGALLANAMSRHFEVMLVTSEEMRKFDFDPNLKVAAIRKNKILGAPNPLVYRRIFQLVKNFQPVLVHDTSGNAFRWTFGLWPVLARRWPLIITEHDPAPHPGMGGFFSFLTRRIAWQSAHHLIVHGKQSRQVLLEAGVEPCKVSITRHGTFAVYNRNRHTEVSEEENIVLFFGELRPNKGIHRLAAIARRVRAVFSTARFIVAGRRTKLPSRVASAKVRRTVAALKAEPGFEVYDRFIEDDEVERLFRRSAVVMLPYEEASQSGVIPVAYAFGKPVVAFDVGDLNESIIDGETGILVGPGDEDGFARAVIGLLNDKIRRHEMGKNANLWAQRELSWNVIADRTAQIYNLVLSRA